MQMVSLTTRFTFLRNEILISINKIPRIAYYIIVVIIFSYTTFVFCKEIFVIHLSIVRKNTNIITICEVDVMPLQIDNNKTCLCLYERLSLF